MTDIAPKQLAAVLDAHRARNIGQATAAKMLGIRKSDFAELAAHHTASLIPESALEKVALRHLVRAFHGTFPWCNPALYKLTFFTAYEDPLWREPRAGECRTYSADEAAQLSPGQRHIHDPIWEPRRAGHGIIIPRIFAPRDPHAPAV